MDKARYSFIMIYNVETSIPNIGLLGIMTAEAGQQFQHQISRALSQVCYDWNERMADGDK